MAVRCGSFFFYTYSHVLNKMNMCSFCSRLFNKMNGYGDCDGDCDGKGDGYGDGVCVRLRRTLRARARRAAGAAAHTHLQKYFFYKRGTVCFAKKDEIWPKTRHLPLPAPTNVLKNWRRGRLQNAAFLPRYRRGLACGEAMALERLCVGRLPVGRCQVWWTVRVVLSGGLGDGGLLWGAERRRR